MCLGIPGRVIEKYESGGLTMGKVDFGGVVKEVCLAYVPEVEIGDYVIIHVGFALTRLDEAEAMETFKLLNELEMLQDELPELSERLNEE